MAMAMEPAPIKKLRDAVIGCSRTSILSAANEAIAAKVDQIEAIELGLMAGIAEVERLYAERRLAAPSLASAEYAAREARDLLVSSMPEGSRPPPPGRVVIGIAYRDIHSIGKMISRAMLASRGFEVCDLGEDVKPEEFVRKAEELNADIIAVGTLMLQSMAYQKQVVDILNQKGRRDAYRVIIGGRPDIITQEFAEEIGADACGHNIVDFVEKIAKCAASAKSETMD
jgi:methanogenic corrinoid protein MtbC1